MLWSYESSFWNANLCNFICWEKKICGFNHSCTFTITEFQWYCSLVLTHFEKKPRILKKIDVHNISKCVVPSTKKINGRGVLSHFNLFFYRSSLLRQIYFICYNFCLFYLLVVFQQNVQYVFFFLLHLIGNNVIDLNMQIR